MKTVKISAPYASRAARLGAAIYWKNPMPLFPITTYATGPQISCAPTVDKWPKP
jgi:hypothetical protein